MFSHPAWAFGTLGFELSFHGASDLITVLWHWFWEQECNIGQWAEGKVDNEPCDYDLLWFRKAKGEVAHFIDSKRVMPGLIDTLMRGCGGNMYAVAVTNKRIIVQNDKMCLFGDTRPAQSSMLAK